MDRRLIGALLVVAVVAVAIVVPARDGLRIAGRGTTIDLPADPQVGDCLLMAQSFGPCAGQSAIGVGLGFGGSGISQTEPSGAHVPHNVAGIEVATACSPVGSCAAR